MFVPRFIYFSKLSPVLLHCSHTNTNCICKRCVNGKEVLLSKIQPPVGAVDHCLFSYLLSVDRFVDQSSTQDNKQEVNDIEDDEHKYDQGYHKHCLKIHTKQVGNKSPRESHRYQCHQHLSYKNNHMHYSSNIDHTEIFHSIFVNPLELSTN